MAEYIDRNLIEWYGCDFEDGSCEHRDCSECSHAECSHTQVMQIPTVQAIPLDKVKEARKEFISKYPKNYMGEPELGGRTCYFSLNEVLEILDEYLAESEG